MKYCHFIVQISLIAFILLTGCIEPTAHVTWAPPIIHPELKNMTTNTTLKDGDTVTVLIGDSVDIFINNFFDAHYNEITWRIGIKNKEQPETDSDYNWEPLPNTGSGLIVKTIDPSSKFIVEDKYKLAVTGTHKGGSLTTKIYIDVVKPGVREPILRNMNANSFVGNGGTAIVELGAALTISIDNYAEALYDNIEWYINDNDVFDDATKDSSVFTVYTSVYPFDTVGKYNLKVIVEKYEETATKTIIIDVKNPPKYMWKDHERASEIRAWVDDPETKTGITGWTPNQGNTGGSRAYYKTYQTLGAIGSPGTFLADLTIVEQFMKDTNDQELWPMTPMTIPVSTNFMIYIRYDNLAATIRVNRINSTQRDIYDFSLGSYVLDYEDD